MIRRWTREDLPQLAALEAACFSEPWTARALEEGFSNPDFECWVCEEAGRVTGYAGVLLAAGEAQIANVATLPDCRGRGVAAAVLGALLGSVRARGCHAATLEVRPSNLPAKRLYARFGFSCEGRRKHFYSDGEDAEILWLRFAPEACRRP